MNKLYIVSTGAGGEQYLTQEALKAIEESEVIVSYTKYAKELNHMFENKELITSGMTQEIQRCNLAIESALEGKTTALISNGDVNVFAMATLVVEIIDQKELWDKIDVTSIAGVTSMLATASRIGAPISQDFAIISLSDRLTPIETIDKRIKCALEADFVIGIYNPISKKRKKPYEILIKHLKEYDNKIAIIASNIGRDEEKITVTDTDELISKGIENELLSMSTMILIGNSSTRLTKNGHVLTPRGYLNKYDLSGDIK
jgi:precorrin-3B C17-methyltransferase